ncbi:sulfurtransferase [Sulfurirhabdus autotrophica]|uniref:Thiosulfate/3-mercaptopyruvate sulfurtransferase n=1 Tax=Sulfurirhabdus autotrophica TaxID=1706046 RepID=A0A4R3Y9Z4_9PROT|nr:rhodanese-like domain-containing protein [Sulfurirhabdus autotrophica]TCV87484.1 thiosulfate/3-mercaptopyruvate sulfurtransferase [Sulfurirhabdus autotrophica]
MKNIFRITLLLLLWMGANIASASAKPDFLVDADWLAGHLKDQKLVVLEVRYHPHRYFTVGHIPGAVQVQRFKDLGDNHAIPSMRFPSREAFEQTLRTWGVNNDSTIVLYDDSVTALTSRVYFLLDLYGFDMKRVKILNGGTIEWSAFNSMTKEETKRKPGNVKLKPAKPGMVVEWTDVYSDVVARRDPAIVLLDSRPADMYTGKVVQHSVRGGHIPGAISIVSLDGADGQSQTWKSLDDIAVLYKSLPKDKTIYAYCHDGFRSSLAWLQLKALGYIDVRIYNGGWGDWGNNLTLPVSEGDQPYDDAFAL